MAKNDFIELLKKRLSSLHHLKAQYIPGNTFVNMRCPFCGDSKTDRNKKRFYVINLEEGGSPRYYCHNCGVSGPLKEALPVLFNDDYEIENKLDLYNKINRRNGNVSKYKMIKRKIVNLSLPPRNQCNISKVSYINRRLGIQLTTGDIKKFKLIVDLYHFLSTNKIKQLTRDKRVCDCLETDYVGFLTVNNDYVIMRNIIDSYKNNKYLKRYENYQIFQDDDTCKRLYIMKNNIDIFKTVEIHIAEGILDIMSVYINVCNRKDNNRIYAAVCGSGFDNAIKFIISQYGIIFNKIIIYSDNEPDKDIKFYKEIKNKLGNRIQGDIIVKYNKLEKDFGVSKDKIDIKIAKV